MVKISAFNRCFVVQQSPVAPMNGVFVFCFHVLLHVRSLSLSLPQLLNPPHQAQCSQRLLCRLVSPSDGTYELMFGAELITTEHWHRVKGLRNLFLIFPWCR